MMLNPGERAIAQDPITQSWVPGYPLTDPGFLHLTNHRLVFEAVPRGSMPRTLVDLNLSQITNVTWGPGAKGTILLRVESGPTYSCTFSTLNARNCAEAIQKARADYLEASARARSAEQHAPSSGSKPMVYLHCKHCGTLNDAGSAHCTGCGASL